MLARKCEEVVSWLDVCDLCERIVSFLLEYVARNCTFVGDSRGCHLNESSFIGMVLTWCRRERADWLRCSAREEDVECWMVVCKNCAGLGK